MFLVPFATAAIGGYFVSKSAPTYYYGSQYSEEISSKANAYIKNIPIHQLGVIFGADAIRSENEINKIVTSISDQIALEGVYFEQGKQAAIRQVLMNCLNPLQEKGKESAMIQKELCERIANLQIVDESTKGTRRATLYLQMEKKLNLLTREDLFSLIDHHLKTFDEIIDDFILTEDLSPADRKSNTVDALAGDFTLMHDTSTVNALNNTNTPIMGDFTFIENYEQS